MSTQKIEDKFSRILKVEAKKNWILSGMFVLFLILLSFWIGFRYSISLAHLHMEWLVIAAIVISCWSGYRRLKFISAIVLSAGLVMAYHLFVELPAWQQKLLNFSTASPSIWIRGRVIQSDQEGKIFRIRLASAKIDVLGKSRNFPELTVQFELKKSSSFYRHRSIQFGGILEGAELKSQRLSVSMKQVLYHTTLSPPHPWLYYLKILHQRLNRRAAFYLKEKTHALYSPLILAQSVYRSKAIQLFRDTGVAHLLTISGLHIGLLFWLGLMLFQKLGWFSERLLLWVYFPQFCQALTLAGLWCYVALIAFPIPALRALVMLSLMVLIRWMGQAHASLYALLTTAFLFICYTPAVIYQVSFQLSFFAVLYILLMLPFLWNSSHESPLWQKAAQYMVNSLLVSAAVLLGIWPILATYFKQLSLEVFWLNLIMLPLLGLIILPICFVTFFLSFLHLNAVPFGIVEKTAFQLTEGVLQLWLETLKIVHSWGNWASFPMDLTWLGWQFLLYYALTFLTYFILISKFKRQAPRVLNSDEFPAFFPVQSQK
ncbi:MAG: ComEC/Rec2 family competence protein [SAR324 cluster bacterium]|nr:ComEC/Rec2 family competence protein [SAR324 cluster bacterium]